MASSHKQLLSFNFRVFRLQEVALNKDQAFTNKNKTLNLVMDFPYENPEEAIEANCSCVLFYHKTG